MRGYMCANCADMLAELLLLSPHEGESRAECPLVASLPRDDEDEDDNDTAEPAAAAAAPIEQT